MNPVTSAEEQALREQISEAEQKLLGLQGKLASVDGELEALAAQRYQYGLLERACDSLQELEQLGSARLFWGDAIDAGRSAQHVATVRERVAAFGEQVAAIEQRRDAVAQEIDAQREGIAYLGEDLLEAIEEEESRQAEWVVEREEAALPYRPQIMPWVRGVEEDWRFRRSLAASMAVALLLSFVLQFIDLPLPERTKLVEVPERVANLIREERRIVEPPQPVVQEPVPEEPEPEPETEPQLAQETPPTPAKASEEPVNVKEQVQSKGILAFRDSFASRAQHRPAAQLGAGARLSNAGESATGRPQRAMVTTTAPGSSGGINLADISRDVGGGGGAGQIGGVQVTQVASSIGPAGGADRPLSGGHSAGRTDEEIQIIFDRYKAALYRLYNRELRKDPTLRGQVVIRLTIEPDGSVSLCQLQSSDMDAPTLVQQVIERIRGFDFGAKDGIVAMTIVYPIDFLPAA